MSTESFIPAPPPGYELSLVIRRIVAMHKSEPPLYLDEQTMSWRILDQHISQVHHAPASSTC